jgi:hypothetical protein
LSLHWAIRELNDLVPPPEGGGDSISWEAHFPGLPAGLPEDYRNFISMYGGGTLDGYLIVASPAMELANRSAVPKMEDALLRPIDLKYLGSYSDTPASMRLFPFAFSGSSDAVYWHRDSDDPNSWRVFVRMRHPAPRENAWRFYDFGAVEFMVRWLRSDIENPFGSDEFPTGDPSYENWREWRS